MKNAITFIVLLLVMVIGLVSFPVELGATPGDIKARMRLYEGFRGDSQQPEKVISSYYLKSISGRYTFSHKEEAKESATLKRVFNLSKVKLITDAMMRLREGEQESPFQVIVLNGRELLLQLRLLDGPNNLFRMEVLEKGKSGKRSLFKGTILLPQAKATALGFEDSAGKIYFLAFQRDKDHPSSKARTRDGKPMIMPKLIRKVQPKYPKEALENKIQGVVVLEA
ncbi:MAG: hypothetical protein GY940_21495, partial [bacterium]|nr:hypothetical protein [bacterium]